MSIKVKLSFLISGMVALILLLNILLSYLSSREKLRADLENEMKVTAREVSIAVEHSRNVYQLMGDLLGEKLRVASVAALEELDPHIANISNDQLVELSHKLGISHISLLTRTPEGDFGFLRSSDPKELGLVTKDWGFWNTAFLQLWDNKEVTIPEGQKLSHFWSGPFDVSTSDPNHVDKWGYYYDGTTDYIINPYMRDDQIRKFDQIAGSKEVISQSLSENSSLLSIAGLNPDKFGKEPIVTQRENVSFITLQDKPVVFGDYLYSSGERDEALVNEVRKSGKIAVFETVVDGKKVLKSFVPAGTDMPYVLYLVSDYSFIEAVLRDDILGQLGNSMSLLLVVVLLSYLLAGFIVKPVNLILGKVSRIAAGHFGEQIPVSGKDEIGQLAMRINTMSDNLKKNSSKILATLEELTSTKEYMESIVNQTTDAIHVVDLDGEVVRTNKAFETMFGWTLEEILGGQIPNVPDNKRQEAGEILRKVREGGQVTGFGTQRLTRAGKLIEVSVTVSPIRDSSGEIVGLASITRNITEHKHTEELLRRSEKLSVVGQLAAGVAHEIRNPLTTLRGFVQLLKVKPSVNPEHLDLMLSELDRINFIVSEFMILAKPQVNQFQYKDLRLILQDMVLLLGSQAHMQNMRIVTEADEGLPLVQCEENQLKQVLLNLIKNGMEAMPGGGEIRVELKNLDPNRVMIRIIDHGVGIPEDHLARLGEPFFTNKESGNGLGLMVSQQIIANHKGSMLIRSELGKGTCIDIILPVHPQ